VKRFFVVLLILGVVLSGCTPDGNTQKSMPEKEQSFSDDFETVSSYSVSEAMAQLLYINSLSEEQAIAAGSSTPIPEMDMENAMETAMGMLGVKSDWPKDYLSPDMPRYMKGEIKGWSTGGRGEYDVFILIKDTCDKDFEEYIGMLINSGFQKNYDSYTKDAFTVKFQFNTDTLLQISSYRVEAMKWPELLSFVPPLNKGYLVAIEEPSEDVSYGNLYFKGLTKADIKEWEEELKASGFTVDSGEYLKENVDFKARNCRFSAYFDSNSTDEWSLCFSFE